jgi:hypothetical protein
LKMASCLDWGKLRGNGSSTDGASTNQQRAFYTRWHAHRTKWLAPQTIEGRILHPLTAHRMMIILHQTKRKNIAKGKAFIWTAMSLSSRSCQEFMQMTNPYNKRRRSATLDRTSSRVHPAKPYLLSQELGRAVIS